jgi:hypothetical protein
MEIQTIRISENDKILLSVFMDEEYPISIDFNWLIPVIDRIFKLEFDKVEGLREYSLKQETIFDEVVFGFHSDIINVYNVVVEFIKWYNKK